MSENVKQEGSFKLQKPKATPRKLNKPNAVTKVDLQTNKTEDTDAIQKQSTDESVLQPEQPKMGLQEMESGDTKQEITTVKVDKQEEVAPAIDNVTVIQEISEEEINATSVELETEAAEAFKELESTGRQLPENIEKLVAFMEETGGSVEDYVRLNADYSNVNNEVLLKEYYKKTRPHLNEEEIDFLMDDRFAYDEDEDDERDIRKKKLAFKEEVAKARGFLDDLKNKYYEEVKLRPSINKDQQKALDFFNRYQKEQEVVQSQHSKFQNDTKSFFTQDFKGFDFKLGDKNFRYGIQNTDVVADKQSNITNLIKRFLNDKGEVTDLKGYHKAMYAAENVDTLANHFYEQGKADAIKEITAKSNNITTTPRQSASGEIFVNGFKVKAVNGVNSTKLKIKNKFNN